MSARVQRAIWAAAFLVLVGVPSSACRNENNEPSTRPLSVTVDASSMLAASSTASGGSVDPQGQGTAQSDMNADACGEYRKAEQELKAAHERLLTVYASEKAFLEKLKASQQQWLKLREADLEMQFPKEPQEYGSVLPMCRCGALAESTARRTAFLREWLNGVEEGEVCAGSVRRAP